MSPALHTAITGDLSERLGLTDLNPIPLEVQLVLAKDPDDGIRHSILGSDSLERATVMLMERDEQSPEIRARLGEELFSSIESKRATPLINLRYDVVEMACEQLGLSKKEFKKIWSARIELEKSGYPENPESRVTLGEILERLGLG